MSALQSVGVEAFGPPELQETVASRFERQVTLHPERLAVKAADETLTYAELNCKANRIGRAVASSLGERSEPVSLLFDHGAAMICAIMGTLKANKFYVALDPGMPAARNRAIITDSGVRLIVTDAMHRRAAEQLIGGDGLVICIDEIQAAETELALRIRPEAPAYIMYTSGSTGEPKGVVHSQQNVLYCARSYVNGVDITADDRFTLLARHNFAGSISNLYGALLAGASVFPFDVRESGFASLADLLRREGITIYQSVPSLFRHFATSLGGNQHALSLRIIKLSGETVFKKDVQLFKQTFGDSCRLLISYGSTELNVVRQFFIDKRTEIADDVVPVGYAVEGAEVIVLDPTGEPTIGRVGEIAIRCRYLANGFWRKPQETAAAFQGSPGDPMLRTYRTGDLGYLRADGCLLHMGRTDQQVKIRGYRVEMTEIEAALVGVPGVREVAVVADKQLDGDRSLTAHVVLDGVSALSVHDLRGALEDKLPSYMVPSTFVLCDALPTTANGKIDRRKLEEVARSSPPAVRYVKPVNGLQHQLVVIWEELLGISPIGVTENFFDLGGNSLLAARMLDAVERACGKRFPLTVLTRAATILDFAIEIAKHDPSTVSSLLELQKGNGRPFFFLHGEFYRGGSYCHDLAKQLGTSQTFFMLPPHGLGHSGELPPITAIAAEHVRAIRKAQPFGPYLLGGYSYGGLVAFEMACQLDEAGEKVGVLVLIGTRCPNPDLALLRSTLSLAVFSNPLPPWLVRLRAIPKISVRDKLRSLAKMPMREKLRRAGTKVRGATTALSIYEEYSQAIRRYVPRRYRGHVTVLWGSDENTARPSEVLRGWSTVARGVDFNLVPGNHWGYLKEHLVFVGEVIERSLREFRQREAMNE